MVIGKTKFMDEIKVITEAIKALKPESTPVKDFLTILGTLVSPFVGIYAAKYTSDSMENSSNKSKVIQTLQRLMFQTNRIRMSLTTLKTLLLQLPDDPVERFISLGNLTISIESETHIVDGWEYFTYCGTDTEDSYVSLVAASSYSSLVDNFNTVASNILKLSPLASKLHTARTAKLDGRMVTISKEDLFEVFSQAELMKSIYTTEQIVILIDDLLLHISLFQVVFLRFSQSKFSKSAKYLLDDKSYIKYDFFSPVAERLPKVDFQVMSSILHTPERELSKMLYTGYRHMTYVDELVLKQECLLEQIFPELEKPENSFINFLSTYWFVFLVISIPISISLVFVFLFLTSV